MRPVLAVLLAAALVAGCGGGGGGTTTAAGPPDPVETLELLLAAVESGDEDALAPLLTRASRPRTSLSELRRRLEPFLGGHKVDLAEPAGPTWAVVAITNETESSTAPPAAFATVLRREGGRWRHEVGSPVRLEPIGPAPGSRERLVVQVAARVIAHAPIGAVALWIDGFSVETKGGASPDGRRYTAFSNLTERLAPGRHYVVGYAQAGSSASALAWAFTVPR